MANRQEIDSIKVCVSLFGRESQYLTGAIQCAQELHDLKATFCTEAELIIYYDATVPHGMLARLKQESIVKLVYVDSLYAGKGTAGTFYRFCGFRDFGDSNAVVCTWDLDNKLNNGFARYMIDMVIDGNAVFYMLKKDRLNRGRRYNADCWSGVPIRHPAFLIQ